MCNVDNKTSMESIRGDLKEQRSTTLMSRKAHYPEDVNSPQIDLKAQCNLKKNPQ